MPKPLIGRIAKLRSNGARFAVVDIDDSAGTITVQGWIHRDTLTLRDFAIRYELIPVSQTVGA